MNSPFVAPGNLLRLIAVTVLATVFASVGPPALGKPNPIDTNAASFAETSQRFSVSGTVDSVSYAANSVRINVSGQHVDILITPTTAIEFRGEAGSIADIHRGRKITASGVVHDSVLIANSIILR